MPRDTYTDGFKLSRKIEQPKPHTDRSTRSSSPTLSRKYSPALSRRNSSLGRSEGNCVSDLTVTSLLDRGTPLVIFECKSKSGGFDIEEGMSQLVSYGLSLRHKKQVKNEIKLVLITPSVWYLASLPPYKMESEIDLRIYFESYGKFGVLTEIDGGLFLDRKAYLKFLINLRSHFQSFKSA